MSLVTNYRDKGENYQATLGPGTETLQLNHILDIQSGYIQRNYDSGCLWYFPSLTRLSRWQYDIRVQRIGNKRGGVYGFPSSSSSSPISTNNNNNNNNNNDEPYWIEVFTILEAYLPLQSNIIHIGISSPLLFLQNLFLGKHLLISPICDNNNNGEEDQLSISCLVLSQLESYLIFLNTIHLVIIHKDYLIKKGINLQEVWNWLFQSEIRYILVIGGGCIEAPTDFTISFQSKSCFDSGSCSNELLGQNNNNNKNKNNHNNFTVVEDVCFEVKGDGATLYKNTKLLSSKWNVHRYAYVKRIAGSLITRRIVDLEQERVMRDLIY